MNRTQTTRTANGGAPTRTASGSAAGQREKVTFRVDETQLVTLEFDDGQEVAGRGGPQAQYFLGENRIMWVDPEISQAIWNTGARAGDTVAITKCEVRENGKKAIEWQVEKVEDETADHPPQASEPDERAAAIVRAMPQAPRAAAAPAPASPTHQLIDELRGSLGIPRTPATAETWEATSAAAPNQIALAMCAAIRATLFAENYGARIGKPVAFGTEDIRAIANTLYISQTRGGN
jgi:hypothetical protein